MPATRTNQRSTPRTAAAKKAKAKPAAGKAASAKKGAKATAPKAKKVEAPKTKKVGATKTKKAAVKAKKTHAVKAAAEAPKKAAAEAPKKKAARDVLDFAEFPAGSVTRHDVTLCLACIFRLFTKQLGLAPRTAYNEIRRYAPTVEELTSRNPQRPFFKPSEEKNPHCPYCEAPKRWHARVAVHRIEGGKSSDAARRALVRKLPTKEEQFQIHEEKKTARQVFFEWLERMGQELDFEDDGAWMIEAARAYIERRGHKTGWAEVFRGPRALRRSQRIEEGWERDRTRLFLAPP